MDNNKTALHIIAHGLVQGVFYRAFTKDTALALGLTGWVRNLPDGSVELEAYGSKQRLEQLCEKLKNGPPSSKVEKLDIDPIEFSEQYFDFSIRY